MVALARFSDCRPISDENRPGVDTPDHLQPIVFSRGSIVVHAVVQRRAVGPRFDCRPISEKSGSRRERPITYKSRVRRYIHPPPLVRAGGRSRSYCRPASFPRVSLTTMVRRVPRVSCGGVRPTLDDNKRCPRCRVKRPQRCPSPSPCCGCWDWGECAAVHGVGGLSSDRAGGRFGSRFCAPACPLRSGHAFNPVTYRAGLHSRRQSVKGPVWCFLSCAEQATIRR